MTADGPPRPFERTPSPSLPLLIAALSMMGPFAIDTYLPSFREMEEALGATPVQIQQSLTAFLLPFAFMSLWHGALSDAFGRRRVIITGFAIVTLASIGCAFARSVEVLWTFRALQGLAAGMFVVGRAVVRDVYEGPAAQRVISQVSVLFAIAPAIAPVLGGYLHQWFGWRSVFLFMALFAGAVSLWSWCSMPETLPPDRRHSLHAGRLARAYGASLSHPGFVACALATAFAFMAIFLYIADANALLVRHLHLPETAFFWLFGPVTAGMMLGGWLSGKVAGKMDSTHTIGWSFAGMIVATGANVTFHVLHPAALPWTVIPLFFYATGMALSMPTLTLLGLDYFPARRGLASSCQAFVLTAGNALTAGLLAPFAATSPLRLSLVSAALMLIAFCCLPFIRRGKIGTE